MLVFGEFECSELVDLRTAAEMLGVNTNGKMLWACEKRESTFSDVSVHCADCEKYKKMLKALCEELERL